MSTESNKSTPNVTSLYKSSISVNVNLIHSFVLKILKFELQSAIKFLSSTLIDLMLKV